MVDLSRGLKEENAMYAELVRELSSHNSRAVVQPPASPEEIRRAEKAVGYPFPGELKALLSEMNGDKWLLFSAGEIIQIAELNREYLLECCEDIDRYIFFAGNGCGDYYGYRVDRDGIADGEGIYLWEHEINESRLVASDIAELITRYYHDEI